MAMLNNQRVFYIFLFDTEIAQVHKVSQRYDCFCIFLYIFLSFFGLQEPYVPWLVVYLPLWKIWVRQLGWHSQYMESH